MNLKNIKTTYQYTTISEKVLGDMHTPVSIYLKVRDMFPQSAMLESSDYHSAENSKSYIALCPIAHISINHYQAKSLFPDQQIKIEPIDKNPEKAISNFMAHFNIQGEYADVFGLLGYTAFDAVKYLEPIPIQESYYPQNDAPDMLYILYKYLLIFDHFRNELTLIQLQQENEPDTLHTILSAIENRNYAVYPFKAVGNETSNMGDQEYKKIVEKAIQHCQRGDVFQMVLSRRFEQPFQGDDFMVYRMLRSINPSPYLFYFDFGGFRIFGSSPETHCKIHNGIVSIDPIAGTAFRTGDIQEDQRRAELLLQDPKENAEHVMLVDLARNDLSRNAQNVHLDFYKKIQYYSHVIHIVSRVSGNINPHQNTIKTFIDTFPAGTLSGAPKVRAMQLINELEPTNRGIYGGCIGIIHFNGNINQAITIRTFVSRNNTLYYQAGAGIVVKSNPEKELQEVNNKLGALKKAIQCAEKKS